jgi:hypothetical protein
MTEGPVNSVLVFIMLNVGKEGKGRGRCDKKLFTIRYHFKFIWKHFVKPVTVR